MNPVVGSQYRYWAITEAAESLIAQLDSQTSYAEIRKSKNSTGKRSKRTCFRMAETYDLSIDTKKLYVII
jgi:hypothetical protein